MYMRMFLHSCIHFISNLTLSITVWQLPDTVDTVVSATDDGWKVPPELCRAVSRYK